MILGVFYVESVTSNSEIGHSHLSKQSPSKNRGPVKPSPFLRIWEVQSHPPSPPFVRKERKRTMRDNQIVNIVNQKLTRHITLSRFWLLRWRGLG